MPELAQPTIVDVIHARALEDPRRPAFTYLADGEHPAEVRTLGELDAEVRAIAEALLEEVRPGARALLLYPHSLEFVRAFLACLYAGVVAVPAYPPHPADADGRELLARIAGDCGAGLLLTTADWAELVAPALGLRFLATDAVETPPSPRWTPGGGDPDQLAFLQYTSGSTAIPKGVMVTHGNLLHAERMIATAFEDTEESTAVGWLPLYHDMGLVGNVLQPLCIGSHAVVMPPQAFLQRPLRWLHAISRYGARVSGGPNFAYDLCVRRARPEELEGLDLSTWDVAFNGAEPVRARTLAAFAETFAPYGFRAEAFYPCYGLAEVTLFASGGPKAATPAPLTVATEALGRSRVEPAEDGTQLVPCGRTWLDRRVAIVDPVSLEPSGPGEVGEIWLAGADVARGYWNRPEETERTFLARLPDGDGPFLRTGDLGFLHDDDVVVTGRLKDVIILEGRNVYPHELEATVEASDALIRPGCTAAFAIERDGREHVAVVAELRDPEAGHPEAIMRTIRRAVALRHGVPLHAIALIEPRTLAKTSSGKVRRSVCRRRFLDGELQVVAATGPPARAEVAEVPA